MNKIVDKTNVFKENLIYEISAGRYRPKEKLPSERLFCERHKISRTTARRALEELEQAGIIERRPPTGAFVCKNAPEIIQELQESQALLSVAFLLPPQEINNPLLQIIFTTCRSYLSQEVRLSVVFDDPCRPISLRGEKADVIFAHGIAVDERLFSLRNNIPHVVLLNTTHEEFNYLSVDNYAGGHMMAEYISGMGHRELGCVGPGGANTGSDFDQRFLGIKTFCDENDISLERARLSQEHYFNLSASCHQALDNLLVRRPKITAVLGLYDMIALYLCESLNLRGRRVPTDMSVIGFDDLFYAQYTIPPLTTIKYPAEAIGMKLAEYIRNITEGKTGEIHELLKPVLIERRKGSVKPVNE